MAVEAVLSVKRTNSKDQVKYPVSAINVLKSHGKRAKDSLLVKGYALNCTIASEGSFSLTLAFLKHKDFHSYASRC
jgi:T-complex protein 1 subunit alpha